jgi:Sec-independent protein translocase protein TatA
LGRAIKNFKRAVNTQNELEVSPKKGEVAAETKAESADGSSETPGENKKTVKLQG